jgi:uncharacterized membrane-anchored protein YhcB (DUF1043 family)
MSDDIVLIGIIVGIVVGVVIAVIAYEKWRSSAEFQRLCRRDRDERR